MKTWKLFHIIIIIYVDFLRLTRLPEKRNHVLLKLHLLMTAKARCTVRSTWLWQRRAAIFNQELSTCTYQMLNSNHRCQCYCKLKTLPLYSSPLVYQHCSQLKLTCYCIVYIYMLPTKKNLRQCHEEHIYVRTSTHAIHASKHVYIYILHIYTWYHIFMHVYKYVCTPWVSS